MKSLFPGYYRPTEEEFQDIWKDCIFVFDANVLLNIYRYTPRTVSRVFEILEHYKDRIWLPNQAAHEFLVNRLSVISTQFDAYLDIEQKVDKLINNLATEMGKYRRHPFINVAEIVMFFQQSAQQAKHRLVEVHEHHPDLLTSDTLWERLTDLFDGRVGPSYADAELQQKYKDSEKRFNQKIPPGYADAKTKEGVRQYGDAILWFQMLDFAKTAKKPLVFVTNDVKEDWWLTLKGRTIGPRPELIQEMHANASVKFYIYQMEQFISYAQETLNLSSEPSVITEIEDIQRQQSQRGQIIAEQDTTFGSPIQYRSFAGEVGPLMFDVNNDGRKELIIPTHDGRIMELYLVSQDGLQPIEVEAAEIGAPYFEDTKLIDIDNDGSKELMCVVGWDTGMGLLFYKNLNNRYHVLRGISPFEGRVTCFIDANIQDYDNDGQFEIVSTPWYEVPKDLLPPDRVAEEPLEEHPWGRVKYVWKWNSQSGQFTLVERSLLYIGGR